MKHISLGGLDVSRIGLGTMAMSGYYLDPDSNDAESSRTITGRSSSASRSSTPPRSTAPTPTRSSSAAP